MVLEASVPRLDGQMGQASDFSGVWTVIEDTIGSLIPASLQPVLDRNEYRPEDKVDRRIV